MSESADKKSAFGLSGEQIERLLSVGYGEERDIEEAPSSVAASDQEPALNAVEASESFLQIDGYEVIEKVAEAGQGQVWRALQQSTDRQVAIKVPRVGSVTSERARVRFEREVELAARLKHPNIARIYDSGVNRGQYYFVMDFIEGLKLDEYVRQHHLTHRQILELMRTICQAVQHAHQKGIIHRDLKPSNIIITDDGRPFIIDFGLAKGLGDDDQNLVLSMDGEAVGTPAYMSPEQAAGHTDIVDTRTDVYSLGVTLFALLTDSNPHDLSGTRLEVMHRIAEQDVIRPRTLNRNIDKDIEALLLKALDKDPDRRYSSAAGLTEDIDNYLKGEPLMAGSQSTVHRLTKFVKRNWLVVTSMAAVLIVLFAGVVVSAVLAVGQARARAESEQRTRDAQAVNEFLSKDLIWLASPFQAWARDATVRSFLDAVSEDLQGKFDDRPLIEASIRHILGTMYQSLTVYKAAEPHFQRALDIRQERLGDGHPHTLDSMTNFAWLYWQQARYDEAEPLAFAALQGRRHTLGNEHTDTLRSMTGLGWVYWCQGHYDKAEPLFVQVLEISQRALDPEHRWTLVYMSHLGTLYTSQGRYDQAEPLLLEATQGMASEWGSEHLYTTLTKRRLGSLYRAQGRYDEAEPLLVEAAEVDRRVLGEQHPYTMASMKSLGSLYVNQDRYDEAEPLLCKALDAGREVLGEEHHYMLWFRNALAGLYVKQERYDEAETLLVEAVDIGGHALGEKHPETLQSLNALIELYKAWGKPEKAEAWRAQLPQTNAVEE